MWSNFENSPLEDETISNTFSSRGMFKMRSEQNVEHYPSVQACVQNKQMVISIDKSLVLVEEDMETKCSFLSFNTNIDVFAISQTGNVMICGLSNGEIHGIYIKGIPLFNVCIRAEDSPTTGKCFAAVQEIGKFFYLICTNGSIYRLCEIDEKSLVKLSITINENETTAADETLFDYVAVERLSGSRGLNNVETAILIAKSSNCDSVGNVNGEASKFELVAGSKRKVFLLGSDDNSAVSVTIPESYGGIKRVCYLDNYILLLTHSGHLLEVCLITKMILFNSATTPNDILIDELIIMESNDENKELLTLTKEETGRGDDSDCERLMKFIQYPSMKCINEFHVPKHSWIVQQPKCALNLYYLRGQDFDKNHFPTEVEMVSVSETHPSERFKKLIAKGYFEEAEMYGRQFELCLQPIYEAKARLILIQLCNLDDNNPELMEERFNELTKFMELLKNPEFYYKHRMINLPSRKITQRFLSDVLKRLDRERDGSHILEILEQLRRLMTLSIIDPYECDSEWQKFVYSENLVKYLTSRLKKDIPIACLIWKRHSAAIISHLNEIDVQNLLTLIPNNTEPFHLIQWLRQYVPIVSNTHPKTMSFITDWGIQKTRTLQYSDHWPEIGLEFITKILEIIEEVQFMHIDLRRDLDQNIAKLRQLVNALQDLSVLKKSYNLIFTLDNYEQESLDKTAFCILQSAHLAHIKNIVNDFLYPIFYEHGKESPINAIRRYINILVARRNTLSTWLERAVACIELLHDEDDRLECALIVLRCCPVPWPETVAPLVTLRFSTHPLALKISSEFEIQVIKIMKVKYGWPADSDTDINLNLLMMRIVKMDFPDMLDDIRVLTKAVPEISTNANFNCCYQLVRRGKSELAFEFFKSLSTKDRHSKYADKVFELFAGFLENTEMYSDEKFIEEQMHLIEFFKLIAPKDSASSQLRLRDIENRFTLFKRFKQNTSSAGELASYQNRLKLLTLGMEQIIADTRIFRDSHQNISKFILNEVFELTAALQMHKIKGIRIICWKLKCLPLTCSLAYSVLESDDCNSANSQDFIDLALDLIAQQILADRSIQNISTTSPLNLDRDPLAFALASDLLLSASSYERNRLDELTELMDYINISNMSYPFKAIHNYYGSHANEVNEIILKSLKKTEALTSAESNSNSMAINNSMHLNVKHESRRESVSIFDDVDVQPSKKTALASDEISVLKFVARTLLVLVLQVQPTNGLFLKLRNVLLDADKDINVTTAGESFFSSLEQLIKLKVHDVWYLMAQYLLDYQERHNCIIIASDFVSLQLKRVFRYFLSQNDCNFTDLIAMAIADNHIDILFDRLEQDLKTDQQKYNFLILFEMYNDFLGEKERVKIIRTKRLKHFYYMEFCKQDPSIKGKFNIDFDSIDKLLKEFRNKQLDVHLLERISRDFNLDLEYMLALQVVGILQSQEMQYEIKRDSFGEEELVMITTVEQIRSLCQPYIDRIKSAETLRTKLKQLIEEINMYFYELYLCVIEILSFIDTIPKEMQIWTSILHFLKHKLVKRRRSRPGQLETDIWLQSQSEISILPKISRFRIPFKPIVEHPLKDVLDNELSVDNCESFFPLIDLHTMLKGLKEGGNMRDYFCMAAVKNCITEYKAKYDTEIWHIQPTNNAFLKSILRLIKHIENPSKKFLLLYFVSNYAPEGADQVEATYECFKYALENEKLISDPKCKEQLLKIKRKYPTLKTQHLLYVYGLTDEKLLHLVENPKELIFNLYHHELILKSYKLDINTVIKEIAELHEINLEEAQFCLLQKWLAFSQDTTDGTVLEETFFEDQHMAPQNSEATENAAENVLRANYILSTWPKKKAAEFLIAHIFPVHGVPNTASQLQMLECLSKLNDGSISLDNVLSQRKYITIKCVHDLKQLGYNSSVAKFENSNKIDILKTIWQNNAQHSASALEVLVNICLGYDIYLERIWNGILKRLVMFNMVRQLNALVDVLSCQPHLLHLDGLLLAWEYVLSHPFKNCNKTRSSEQEEVLLKNLFRLQSCPVLEKLNLLDFATRCTKLDRPHMAAVLIAFTKRTEEREKIKQLITTCRSERLRKDILDLEEAGILPTILTYSLKELEL